MSDAEPASSHEASPFIPSARGCAGADTGSGLRSGEAASEEGPGQPPRSSGPEPGGAALPGVLESVMLVTPGAGSVQTRTNDHDGCEGPWLSGPGGAAEGPEGASPFFILHCHSLAVVPPVGRGQWRGAG